MSKLPSFPIHRPCAYRGQLWGRLQAPGTCSWGKVFWVGTGYGYAEVRGARALGNGNEALCAQGCWNVCVSSSIGDSREESWRNTGKSAKRQKVSDREGERLQLETVFTSKWRHARSSGRLGHLMIAQTGQRRRKDGNVYMSRSIGITGGEKSGRINEIKA